MPSPLAFGVTIASGGCVTEYEGNREIARTVGPRRLDPEPGPGRLEVELLAAELRADLNLERFELLESHVGLDRQPAALAACMSERVVKVVVRRRHCSPSAEPSQEPELLEVADVGELPDERRLERRDLARQLLIRERFQQILRPPSRALESYDELRR
jgi:hypothetical protein